MDNLPSFLKYELGSIHLKLDGKKLMKLARFAHNSQALITVIDDSWCNIHLHLFWLGEAHVQMW